MNKFNLALRETLIILFPGYIFSVFLFSTVRDSLIPSLETEFPYGVSAILFGGILYSLNWAKEVGFFKKSIAVNKASEKFGKKIGESEFFKFYDSKHVSDEFKSKENIYTSLYHMFFNSSVLMLLVLVISIFFNCRSEVAEWNKSILIGAVSSLCIINTYLIFTRKVKKSFERISNEFIQFIENQ